MNRSPTCVVRGKFTWLAVLTMPKFALFGFVLGAAVHADVEDVEDFDADLHVDAEPQPRRILKNDNDHCGSLGSFTSWNRCFATRYSFVPSSVQANVPSGRGLFSAVLLLSNHRSKDCSLFRQRDIVDELTELPFERERPARLNLADQC